MEPEPNQETNEIKYAQKYDQRGQTVENQTNIAGGVHLGPESTVNFITKVRQIFHLSPEKPSRPAYEQALLQLVKFEVTNRLEESLHNAAAYINLDKREDPGQIEPLWAGQVQHGKKPAFDWPPDTSIQDILSGDRAKSGIRLLILGQPGSGKTTELLKIAEILLKTAEKNHQQAIPVLFNLSSWKKDDQSIKNWLINELIDHKPSFKISRQIAENIIENAKIIPLLDGLDELAADRQALCVQKINHFLQEDWQYYSLVVSSRLEEYNNYPLLLNLNRAIILKPLTDNQIKTYIQQINSIEIWPNIQAASILISENSKSLGLARIPLFLYIITVLKDELNLQDWQRIKSEDDRKSYLISAYIREMLNRPYPVKYQKYKFTNKKTQDWLGWMAYRLIQQNNTEFFRIEDIQPNWLKKEPKNIPWPELKYRLIIWAILGSCGFLILSLCCFSIAFPIFGFKGALIVAVVIGTSFGGFGFGLWGAWTLGSLGENIQPVSQLNLTFGNLLKLGIMLGVVGLITWVILYGVSQIVPGFTTIVQNFSIFLGLNLAVMLSISAPQIEKTLKPNQEILNSLNYGLFFAIWGVAVCAFFGFLFNDILTYDILGGYVVISKQYSALVIGVLGLFFGFSQAGMAAIQHFALRLILWSHGYIPWNYAAFLEYATDRRLLQRVGGGYRFIHGLLRDHFAQIYQLSKK
jgi:energy-coupling factor transporter ATP-binding protein EcfA2